MSNTKILVIDDEEGMGRIFERLLGERGQVLSTTSGQKALEMVDEHSFELIVCDLNMPELSGIEFFEALEAKGGPTDKVIFITGGAFTPEDQNFVDELEDRVLYKPFGIDELDEIVDRVLG